MQGNHSGAFEKMRRKPKRPPAQAVGRRRKSSLRDKRAKAGG